MKMQPRGQLRKNEKAYEELDLKNYSEEQILVLMLKNRNLILRPIIEKGSKAILARLPEKIKELFE